MIPSNTIYYSTPAGSKRGERGASIRFLTLVAPKDPVLDWDSICSLKNERNLLSFVRGKDATNTYTLVAHPD